MNRAWRVGFVCFAAACLGPPAVAPNQTLAIDHPTGGPRTRGAYAVVFSGPKGTVENRAEPGVTVLFNRAMRTLEDEGNPPIFPVTTTDGAAVAGKWRWIGTHGALFQPDADLPGGTPFQVTVPRTTRSMEGDVLPQDHAFSFSTAAPKLLASLPAEGAATLKPDASIRLEFNQAIAPAELSKVTKLVVRTGSDAKEVTFQIATLPTVPTVHAVTLTPSHPLPLDASIEVDIAKGLRGQGPLVMEAGAHLHVRTFGPLRLAQVTCPRVFDGTLGKCQAHRDIQVALNNDVLPDELRAHLVLGKLPKAPAVPHPIRPTMRPQTVFALGANPDFDQRYRVTLTAGLTDVYGQRLARDIVFDVDTEPPFSRTTVTQAAPVKQGDNDEPPPENVAARAIPPFELGFGVEGYVLEAGLGRHIIPVGLVNVPTFGLVTRKLDVRETKQYVAGLATRPGGFLDGGVRFAWETPDPAANMRAVRSVDLDALLGPARRGTAFLALGTPAQQAPLRQDLLSVTDLGITAKMSKFGGLVWVTALSTGKPVGGAQVAVGLAKKDDARTFVTDDQGIALLPPDAFTPIRDNHSPWGGDYASLDPDWLIVASKGDDWTFTRVEQSPTLRRTAVSVDLAASRQWQGTLFSDRGVYRTGETVKLAAVLRQADARGITVVEGRDVHVTVVDGENNKVFESRGKLDAYGGLAMDVPVPKSARLGQATATLSTAPHGTFSTTFILSDYKPVEFLVTAEPERRELVRGDHARFSMHAEYLFHAPVAKAPVHDLVVRSVTSFVPRGAGDLVTTDEVFTGDYTDKNPRSAGLLERDATVDPSGDHDVAFDLAMPGQTRPELVSYEATVEDFTRQTVAGEAAILVHPADFYLALKPPPTRFVSLGATLQTDILALKPDGAHVAGASTKLELLERRWTTVVEDSGLRRSSVVDTVVGTCSVVTAVNPTSCPLRVPGAGYFIVRATAKDGRGNPVRASTGLYSLADRPDTLGAPIGWSEGDARVVKLESDKRSYEPGDTAKVLVRNPFGEASVLVTVERGGVMATQTTVLRGPMPVLSVPIQDDYFPNVFVSVHLLRGRVQTPPSTGADLGGPDYRDGALRLDVSPKSHRLTVDVRPDRKDHRPGDELDADVLVTDAHGQPTRAELTFYAVDEGVLALTGYKTPDPLEAFTSPRSLAVTGLETRDHLARILAWKAERLRNRGWDVERRESDKGDDGGDGGGEHARRDFRATAYFETGRATGADGKARFHFKLPDNLTSFRLMAVAAAADRFGSGDTQVVSSKRLMARPALPRTVRAGDSLEASVVVTGKGIGPVPIDVTMKLAGAITAVGPTTQHVTLGPAGNLEVHFPVTAKDPGDATVTFVVSGAGERDTVVLSKRVTLPLHLESTAVYGETSTAAAVALGDLSRIRSDQGALDVRVSSSALVGLGAAFDELDRYPYGCTEQLASRMIPLLSLDDLARSAGVRVPAATDARMEDAVAQLLSHQHPSGGFGYWDNDEEEAWLSAYALLALDSASKRGFYVPHDALDTGVEYLRTLLARWAQSKKDTMPRDDDGTDERAQDPAQAYATAAFLADALATLGKPDSGYLNQLYDTREREPLFTQALLLHGMALTAMPKPQLTTLAAEIVAGLRVDADAAFAQDEQLLAPMLDSPGRTTALVLRALLAVDPAHPLASRLAKGLLTARSTGAWASTQESAWSLVALDAYRKAQEPQRPDFDVSVFLGSTRIGTESFHDHSLHEQRITLVPSKAKELGGPLSFAVSGTGKLFYSAELTYEIADLPKKALDRGLYVQKTMHAVKLDQLDDLGMWIPKHSSLVAHGGDLVVVDLLLESAERAEQVLVEDPLPAGLEAVDFDFATTGHLHRVSSRLPDGQRPTDALDTTGIPFRDPYHHRELRDDRVLYFVPHLEPGIVHFRYLARATTLGTFVMPPTSAACMYSPEVYGRTAATRFEVQR